MALNLDMDIGDSVTIGGAIVTLIHKTGRIARISVDVDREVPVSLTKSKFKPSKSKAFNQKERMSANPKEVSTHGENHCRS